MMNVKLLLVVFAVVVLAQGRDDAQRVSQARIPPLEPSAWTDTHREILRNPLYGGSRDRGAETPPLYTTCLRNAELCRNWMPLTSYLLSAASGVPARDKELLILRTAWLCRADYPWAGHFSGGKRVGFTDEEISRITKGPDAKGWSSFDAVLLRAADQLHSDQFITDPTWKALAERYNERQLLDLVFTVGQYTMLSMFTNSAGIQLTHGPALPK